MRRRACYFCRKRHRLSYRLTVRTRWGDEARWTGAVCWLKRLGTRWTGDGMSQWSVNIYNRPRR